MTHVNLGTFDARKKPWQPCRKARANDLGAVTAQVEALRTIQPASFDLAYAVKANPSLAVLRHLAGPPCTVAVLDVGAYGATESMPFFRSHAMPAEVVLKDGVARLARPRVEPEVWLGWHVDNGDA